ncbi:MAG: cytochrome c3 family protein [Deltaproteobacteria bacterium]|nr:cytochrome c3 family protein [Deltaproteobacteria bacterium]MBW2118685.1 cytochrome c3 family protein [Deltaproteobacteria bacterium]MBW2343311.1 cytochrome c3 family protein [Deltaproteobacteria bacterium]
MPEMIMLLTTTPRKIPPGPPFFKRLDLRRSALSSPPKGSPTSGDSGGFLAFSVTRLIAVFVILIIPLVFTTSCTKPDTTKETDYADCLACHKGIERISANHEPECAACHIRPEGRSKKRLADHKSIIRNPSDPAHVYTFCLPCHEKKIKQVKSSLHSTMAGIINQTRYLWGAQKRASPAIYGLDGPFKKLPAPDPLVYPETPQMLVDDFLRRRCLRCHIHNKGPEGRGLYRATGCAACHVIYKNDGRYRGSDEAIDRSVIGYPAKHEFTKRIPNMQCLHCHNQNHVGADYEGLFEHDYTSTYRSPLVEGKPAPMIYGLDYHHLAKDIHAEKGLLCIDCHEKEDVMGNGNAYSYEMEVPKRSCADCHGGFDNPVPDLSITAIRYAAAPPHEGERVIFISKNQGQKHPLPLFSKDSAGHNISAHTRVRCSACHAQWSYQDYGLSIIREDVIQGYKWYYSTAQGDPYLQEILEEHIEHPEKDYPVSMDWVSGESRPGIWSAGWRVRRWEFMPLGVDHKNRYAILRPLYQYLITYVDRLGNVPLDSAIPSRMDGGRGWAFMPYVPHTVSPFGRSCDSCHQNRMAAGLGIMQKPTMDTGLTIPSPPAVKTMRLLNADEKKKFIEPSRKWRKERLRALTGS